MDDRGLVNRLLPITAVGTVVLWVAGLTMIGEEPDWDEPASELAAYFADDSGKILSGSLVFLGGCLLLLWFLNLARTRLGEAEGAGARLSSLAFAAGAGTAVMLMASRGLGLGVALAIEENEAVIEPATAQFAILGSTSFFIVAELLAGVLLLAVAAIGFKTVALPKWHAWGSALIGVVLLIPPIGWLGLLLGVPLWLIVTGILLSRGGERTVVVTPA